MCFLQTQYRFYEAYGIKGWQSLEKKTINYINEKHPEILPLPMQNVAILVILFDVRKSVFNDLNFDSVTVAPYMGKRFGGTFLSF